MNAGGTATFTVLPEGWLVTMGAWFTVWVSAELVLPAKFTSPEYTAVMLCMPAESDEVLNVAVVPLIVPVPSVVEPSRNVTVPVAPLVTVAVNVTDAP